MILTLSRGRKVHVDATKIESAWKASGGEYIVRFGKEDTIKVDEESFVKVVKWLDWPEEAVEPTPPTSLDDLCADLRGVYGMSAFAALFGFDMSSDEDWTWHDVAMAMADRIERSASNV